MIKVPPYALEFMAPPKSREAVVPPKHMKRATTGDTTTVRDSWPV